jgi:hypothetical protein
MQDNNQDVIFVEQAAQFYQSVNPDLKKTEFQDELLGYFTGGYGENNGRAIMRKCLQVFTGITNQARQD